MNLVDTEDFIIAAAKAALGSRVRGVQSLPGDWDGPVPEALRQAADRLSQRLGCPAERLAAATQ